MMLSLLSLFSCSLGNIHPIDCSSSKECYDNFGSGYVCETDGYCSIATLKDGCTIWPTEAESNLQNYTLLGSLYEPEDDKHNVAAMNMAVQDVNAEMKETEAPLLPFAIVHCDIFSSNPDNEMDDVEEATSYLSQELQISAILGPSKSKHVEPAYKIAQERPSIIFSPSSTSMSLTTLDNFETPGLFWRAVASDVVQAKILASYIVENHSSDETSTDENDSTNPGINILTVFADENYSKNFKGALEEIFTQDDSNLSYASQDLDEALENIPSPASDDESDVQEYDAIIVIDSNFAKPASYTKELWTSYAPCGESAECTTPTVYVTDGSASAYFVEALFEDDSISPSPLFGSKPGSTSESADLNDFEERLRSFIQEQGQEAFTALPVYSPYAYDVAYMTMLAFYWVKINDDNDDIIGITDAYSISTGLRYLVPNSNYTGVPEKVLQENAWRTITTSLDLYNAVDITGVSGPLDFDLETEELKTPIDIWYISESRQIEVLKQCQDCDQVEYSSEHECDDNIILELDFVCETIE